MGASPFDAAGAGWLWAGFSDKTRAAAAKIAHGHINYRAALQSGNVRTMSNAARDLGELYRRLSRELARDAGEAKPTLGRQR